MSQLATHCCPCSRTCGLPFLSKCWASSGAHQMPLLADTLQTRSSTQTEKWQGKTSFLISLVSRLRREAGGCRSWVPGQAGQERGPGGRHLLLLVLGAACSARMCVKPWPLLFLIFCFYQWLENYIQITTTQVVVLILEAIVQHMSWEEAIYSNRNANRKRFSFSLQSI